MPAAYAVVYKGKSFMKTNPFFKLISLFFIVTLSIFSFSCKKDKAEYSFYVRTPDVTYNDSGIIDELVIDFNGSVCKLSDVNKEPSAEITIKPEINGKWKWNSDSSLVFTPKEKWQLGTKYTVNLPKELYAEYVTVKGDPVFETRSFNIYLTEPEFYINPEDPSDKRVTCTAKATHPIDKTDFERHITATLSLKGENGTKAKLTSYKFSVSYNSNGTEAYIITDKIPVPSKTSEMTVNLSKGVKTTELGKCDSSDSVYVDVPGMSDFVRINEISLGLAKNDSQNYDQILTISTKGKISQEELLKHFVIYELPKDRPEMQGYKAEEDFYWTTQFCTQEIINKATKITLESIPLEEGYSEINSFKFKATENRFLFIKITSGLNFFGGYKLSDEYKGTEKVPSYPTELGILSEGTILSLSGSKKLAMYSRGLQHVKYSLARIMPKDINHLISMSNGNMRHFQWDSYNFNENNISEKDIHYYTIPDYSNETISYFSFDFSSRIGTDEKKHLKNGLFLFSVQDYENNISIEDKRFILITDLGFFVKRNNDSSNDIFVQSISSGKPVANAEVSVIGLNGNALVSAYTDSNGHVVIPDCSNYTQEHKAVAFVVKTHNDLSFMPYSEYGRSLDYSNFDVGGEYTSVDPSKVSAFMFCDRGIYRPGDKINLGVIAKSGDWNINLKNTPVELSVTDPNGSILYTKKIALSQSGFEEFNFSTQEYSPTGYYKANLYLIREYSNNKIDRIFLNSLSFKVEEFLADTLALTTGFDPLPKEGWINPGKLKGTITLNNLFGTPAAGNTIKAQLTLTSGSPSLRKYRDYYFSDPFSKGYSYEEYLGDTTTDDKGHAEYEIDTEKFEKATYRLSFYVEAHEKGGGRSVSEESSVYVSPLKYLIGYKADGSLNYINKKAERKLSFIAVNQDLNKIDLSNVNLTLEEIKYVSTLVKQPNGLFKYQSIKKLYPVSSEKISISKDGTDFYLPTENAGEFKITLTDKEGLVFNTIYFSIVGEQNITRSLNRTAQLEISLEKTDLASGEDAKIFIKAPYKGAGLITVERDKVYSWKWFKTDELSSVQTIRIPKELEGNGYINIMFTRSIDSEEIFMSPFCYGAVPFSIDKTARTNQITLNIPDEIKSGTDLNINYSTAKPGKIIIYAVDEGILRVANYSLPNPLAFFFKKRALQVNTSQILDLVLPEYNVLKTVTATGGGGGMDELAKNLNPFKRKRNAPVVFWSGIIDSSPEEKTVTYHVPDYFNGSIRVMAVAVSPDSIGVTQNNSIAANTFIITPNTPLAATPGDEFDISVTVTNNHKGSGNNKVTLSLVPSSNLEIINNKAQTFTIAEKKDATAFYRVKAKNSLGNAEIKFIAKDITEVSTLSATMSIRPSMPYQTWISSGQSTKKQETVDVNHILYDEYASRHASVSNVPNAFMSGLSFYLEKYPYGCSEQVTSKAYPYLYEDFVKAGNKTHEDAVQVVQDAISILQSRLKSNGHIGYWTTESSDSSFITLYCAEFLSDAKANGFYVPDTLFEKVISRVKSIADTYGDSESDVFHKAYAIYILTKNEIVTTSYIEKLEGILSKDNYTQTDYEGLYLAASYAMLKQDKKANAIFAKIQKKKKFDSSWEYHNGLHYISTYIEVIAKYFPQRISDIKQEQIDYLTEQLSSMSLINTLSSGAAIRAFEAYSNIDKSESFKAFEINGKTETELSLTGTTELESDFSKNAQKIKFTSTREMPMYYQTIVAGFESSIPAKEIKDGLEITREFCDARGNTLKNIKVGDDVYVKISFRSINENRNNIAIVDLHPAGLEADIPSIREFDSDWKPDYVDIREDRVIIYVTATTHSRIFTYKAKAINSGTFIVPPAFAESMYNKDIRAIAPQNPITIEKAK